MLGSALLIRPTGDAVIGAIGRSWRTRLVMWPWGSLGADDWSDEVGMVSDDGRRFFEGGMETVNLWGMTHSEPVSPENRRWLYESIIGPELGLENFTKEDRNES
jgi:hypothetical protein